jgi:squalene-hopene/tetraprenyl-beta-curcumene cyclase
MKDEFGFAAPSANPASNIEAETESEARQQLLEAVSESGRRASDALLSFQTQEGYWCGDLIGDSTLLSDYVLLQLWLHPPAAGEGWPTVDQVRLRKLTRAILQQQLPDGGWNLFADGPADINATVKAYTALKIAGEDIQSPAMKWARRVILRLGGLQACNSYTKLNLSFFGLFPRRFVPTVPPEILLIPGNVLYEMSSWTRTIIVPLSIIQATGVIRPVSGGMTVKELFDPHTKVSLPKKDRISEIFVHADRLLKFWEGRGMRQIRAKAIRAAERWMLAHLQYSDGLGAIYPAMMYAIMAMGALGYERDQPDLELAIRQFEDLLLEKNNTVHYQPCKSPVWDTAIAAFALGEMGGGTDSAKLTQAADWLLSKEVRRKGDWSEKRPNLTPSGWAFEFANEFYPDIDDTAMVLLALLHAKASDQKKQKRVERRAVNWLLGMQSANGGWGAFDVDNNWEILNKIPFADHNAMLDPTCADITGRVLESLCRRGMTYGDPAVRRGVRYLLMTQEKNGSWYGRWGVNYIYGTFLALRGLRAAAAPSAQAAVRNASNWLESVQNEDGGWGESCLGYQTGTFVPAPSTPSQTAWAVLGLIAAGRAASSEALGGLQWLLDRQLPDGTWEEKLTTGTGFPNVFYLSYDLYRIYFPLIALSSFLKACGFANNGRHLSSVNFEIDLPNVLDT